RTVASPTRRRWLVCAVRRSVSCRSRVTSASNRSCVELAGGRGARRLVSANHRTERGLARATGTPCLHRRTKANFSYPPVASMATRATPFSRQNVASASIPGVSLVKRRTSAPGRRTTSRLPEDTSTPQMSLVTVTCLVRASVAPATVRSCETTAMVPKLTRGCGLRWGGRQSPREGADGHRPPRSDAFTTSRRHLPDTRWGDRAAHLILNPSPPHGRRRTYGGCRRKDFPGLPAEFTRDIVCASASQEERH